MISRDAVIAVLPERTSPRVFEMLLRLIQNAGKIDDAPSGQFTLHFSADRPVIVYLNAKLD